MLGGDRKVVQVRYIICTNMEGCKKLLVPKINFLWKRAGRKKAFTNMGCIKHGNYYFLMKNQHARNEQIYFARQGNGGDTVIQMPA